MISQLVRMPQLGNAWRHGVGMRTTASLAHNAISSSSSSSSPGQQQTSRQRWPCASLERESSGQQQKSRQRSCWRTHPWLLGTSLSSVRSPPSAPAHPFGRVLHPSVSSQASPHAVTISDSPVLLAYFFLVGGWALPLWKIWTSVGMMIIPQRFTIHWMGFRENLQDSTHPVKTFRIFRTMRFYPRWVNDLSYETSRYIPLNHINHIYI